MTKCYRKVCKGCSGQNTKKDGTRKGRQSYRCKDCGHVWVSPSRKKKALHEKIYKDFSVHKQTYKELAEKYDCSVTTIQKRLDKVDFHQKKVEPTSVVLLIDTTYFGKNWGVIVFKDARNKKILHHQVVCYETNEGYKQGIQHLQNEGWTIRGIVCDGKKGLLGGFNDIPTQMCHFHQASIVRRYITKKPTLEPNKELKEIVDWLSHTDKETFESELNKRHKKHKDFLNEKGVNDKGKGYFIHRKTRSAYYSLKRNLPYLFVCLDYLGQIDIPNTTNGLEGKFSHLKGKVSIHRGLKKDRKIKLILRLLYNS